MLERQGFVCTSFNSVWLISCMCFFTPLLMNNSVTLFIMLIFLEQMRNYLGFKQKVPKERALAMGSPDPEARSCFQRDLKQPAVHTGLHLHRLTGRRPASHLSEFSLSSNFSDCFPPSLPLQPGLSGQFLLRSKEMSRKFKVPVADTILLGRGKANSSWGGHLPKRSSEETSSKPSCCMEAF